MELTMTTHLRRITTFVDEPEPGAFYWVMIESSGDASVWVEVDVSDQPYCTWLEACMGGSTALMQLVSDDEIGPRAVSEDEHANPVGRSLAAAKVIAAPLDRGA